MAAAREKRIAVISDLQVPHHSPRVVAGMIRFVKDYRPDVLYFIGDEWDATAISRWARGTTAETSPGALQAELDATRVVMSQFCEAAGDVPTFVHRSNHTDRMNHYLSHAPALRSLNALTLESLLGYDEMGIKINREPYDIAPGWVAVHGDENGGINQTAGGTALAIARKVGRSVIAGHTHKLGMQHFNAGYAGNVTRMLTGFEVGHAMNYPRAGRGPGPSYLKTGGANWQQGFGVLRVLNGNTYPQPVPVIKNRFVVDGKAYEC